MPKEYECYAILMLCSNKQGTLLSFILTQQSYSVIFVRKSDRAHLTKDPDLNLTHPFASKELQRCIAVAEIVRAS